jgi:hypothetical protein
MDLFRTLAGFAATLASTSLLAAPVYLNDATPISAVVGPNTTMTTANNTFQDSGSVFIGRSLPRAIDAPSADASEVHNQLTHNWFSGSNDAVLEVLFDFGQEYAITELHFWNYDGEGFDVDRIEFSFFDALTQAVGTSISLEPALGSTPNIFAEDIALVSPLNVRFVTALLSGSNGQVDFQNIGFTAELTTDICAQDPTLPVCNDDPPTNGTVPEPSLLGLLAIGLMGIGFAKRRA